MMRSRQRLAGAVRGIAVGLALVAPPVLRAATVTMPLELASPDGRLLFVLNWSADNGLTCAFHADGRERIRPAPAGFEGGVPVGVARQSVDTTWRPVWGKRAIVPETYNELRIDMTAYRIEARAYNDGVAFRFAGGAGRERTEFDFAGDYTAWSFNGEHPNVGPERLSDMQGRRLPPVTLKADDAFLAVLEAELTSGEPLAFESVKGETRLRVVSAGRGWRVIQFGRSPGALVDSHLIELLNPPPAPELDFSWVRPGVAVWDWRTDGAQADGFSYTRSLPTWKRLADFAAENRIPYLILDADWYGPEWSADSDPTVGGKAADVRAIIAYGRERNVGVWLYLNDVGGRRYPLADTLRQYAEWGAAGVKYGFMRGTPAEKTDRTRLITELCARHRLLCNFHDNPVPPHGQLRTWPNAVTREFCHSQLDAHRVFQPGTFVTAVYVNMLAGPLDMCNGLVDLRQAGRADNPSPVPSTLAGEAARTLIVFSGATIIPDLPENYRRHAELLRFVAAQRQPWRESRTLAGAIGEFIVMARQAADGAWLVGAATNEDPRELDIPLSFLGPGQFSAMIVEDDEKSDFRTRHEGYRVTTRAVTMSERLHVRLAPGGGSAVILLPVSGASTRP